MIIDEGLWLEDRNGIRSVLLYQELDARDFMWILRENQKHIYPSEEDLLLNTIEKPKLKRDIPFE